MRSRGAGGRGKPLDVIHSCAGSYPRVTTLAMLYERWRAIVSGRRGEVALWDAETGRRVTFGELDAAAERGGADGEGIAFIHGDDPEFLVKLIRAWRVGRPVCPLEPGQPAPEIPTPPAGCVHLKLTSGSTGRPRMVAFRQEQLAADPDNILATMGLRREWPNLGVVSISHSYGFSNLALPLLLHGIPLIRVAAPLPEMVWRAAEGYEGVTLAAVPAMWRAWSEAGSIPGNTRLAISAGAPLPLALERTVHEREGLKIHNFYGSSECGGIAFDASLVPRETESLAGAPMRGVELGIGENGCLEVRGAAVGEGYWPEAAPGLGGGVFRSADLAEIREGSVHLLGRMADVINVAGRKLSPETVERELARHPGVVACAVFGVPSAESERVDDIVACVEVRDAVTMGELKAYLLEGMPAWQVPRHWKAVNAVTRSALGKVSRAEWRRRYLEREW